MKKILVISLVGLIVLLLCSCEGVDGPTESKITTEVSAVTEVPTHTDLATQEVTETEKLEEKADIVQIGDKISLGFAEMTLEAFEVSNGYNFEYTDKQSGISITHKSSIDCPSGMKLVCLKGRFTNKTKKEVYPNNNPANGVMILNGNEYRVSFQCFNAKEAEPIMSVVPQQQVDYFFYAEVPSNVANAIETCEVYSCFVEEMDASKWVNDLTDYDYLYKLDVIPKSK